ncbi:MAG: hypothetical protein IJC62_05420 [Clostridia bacterium]|nr:hypothetical protein [Clostridia bacterium]
MTYQSTYTDSSVRLANKLKSEYTSRGEDLSGMRASSTSELVRRAAMGRDPRVNCADQAFRENYRAYENTKSFTRVYNDIPAGASKGASANRRPSSDGSRKTASSSRRSATGAGRTAQGGARTASKTQNRKRSSQAQSQRVRFEKITPNTEVRVQSKALSPMFIFTLLVTTVMVMLLVMNVSEIYSKTNRISELEKQLELLEKEAAELTLKVEERTDIREIEYIATTQLGMVKEDALQKKYVSLSGGERIDVFDDETKENKEDGDGVLLSSIFSSLGKFFDSFK